MALIRPSSIVGSISGAIGGVTFVAGKGTPVVRHRPRFSPRASESLTSIQSSFVNASRTWSTLTNEQRQAWRALAANRPQPNRLGQSSAMNGFALFVQVFSIALRWSGTQQLDPPLQNSPQEIVSVALKATAPATADATLSIDGDTEPTAIQIVGHRPFSAILPKFLKPWREVFLDVEGPPEPWVLDFGDGWNAVYGPLVAGEAIAIRLRILDPGNMLLPSPFVQASAIVA